MTTEPAPGVTARTVETARLRTRILEAGDPEGDAVLFLHGNLSSATWWEPVLTDLPDGHRAVAPDLRGYGDADPDFHVDATRGMADHVEDVSTLMEALGIGEFHVVGSSLGGVVVWSMMGSELADRLLTVTQVAPGSPYGFGATKGVDGEPVNDDYAGAGGGLINPEFVERIEAGDKSTESPFSPLSALALITKTRLEEDIETRLLDSLLATHIGPRDYPGDVTPSPNWPFVAPGEWGSTNALSPGYLTGLVDRMLDRPRKVPVLWVRGDGDVVVSDSAASDPGTWGPRGIVPGYPGPDAYPPQPMLAQTRSFLDRYAGSGGAYEEVVIEDCGHIPYVEKPEEFTALLGEHLSKETSKQ